jgi:Carboxypeptidase regulatory-like domain
MRAAKSSRRILAVAALLPLAFAGPMVPTTHAAHPNIPGDTTGLDVTLPIGRTISGTITDGSAQPIVGMTVDACRSGDFCSSATTAADGSYTIAGLPPDTYVVNVDALDSVDFLDSWYTPGGPVADSSGASSIDLTASNVTGINLTPLVGFSISGTVTGAGAGPLAGVQVFTIGGSGGSGISDASGHFAIHHVSAGTYLLGENMPAGLNYVSGEIDAGSVIEGGPGTEVVVSGASLTGQDFAAPQGFRISGTLTGSGASGARVDPSENPPAQCTCPEVVAAANGTWQVAGLWPGTYQLLFQPASDGAFDNQFVLGYWDGTSMLTSNGNLAANVVVSSADRTGINAAIPAGPSISGTVTGSDGPITTGAFVQMCGQGGVGCVSTLTAAEGTWSFKRVPAGSYQVQAAQQAHVPGYFGPGGYAVDAGLATTIVMAGTSRSGAAIVLPGGVGVSGRISGPSDESIAGVSVGLVGEASPGGEGFATTAADGTYRVAGRPAGDYQLAVGPTQASPYLSGYYDAAAPGHFTTDPNQATSIPIDDGIGSSYVPITPLRVVDSRKPLGVASILRSGVPQTFAVATVGTIPPGATAVTGNLTVVGQTAAGYVAITPTPTASPSSSTLNVPLGDVRANNFTIPLAGNGSLAVVYVAPAGKTAHVIVDITGFFVAGSAHATYSPIPPVRVLDSRPVGNIGLAGKFVANVPRTLTVAGTHGIPGGPSGAVAITANLTVVGQTKPGYLSVTPTPASTPGSSTLNFPLGDTRANGLSVALSGGTVSIVYKAASGTTDVLLDVTGYYTQGASGLLFYPLPPGRLLDSRSGVLATALSGSFSAKTARTFAVAGRAGIPLGAAALTGNLTVVGQTAAGYAAITETPMSSPSSSTLNFPLGDTRANGVTSPIGLNGNASLVYVAAVGARTQLLLDVTGYFK